MHYFIKMGKEFVHDIGQLCSDVYYVVYFTVMDFFELVKDTVNEIRKG